MSRKILIINPNSTQAMTEALMPLVDKLAFSATTYTYLTAPKTSPASINGREDIALSLTSTLPAALPLLPEHSAVLIACYSPHPLVEALRRHTTAPVVGILEASIGVALQLCDSGEFFGIVSTGKQWEEILGMAVYEILRGKPGKEAEGGNDSWKTGSFLGVETTGLNAVELHDAPQAEVRHRVQKAVKRLLDQGNVKCVILGCAGMSGMDEWVREVTGDRVWVIDGVMAGISTLQGVLRARF